MFQLFADAGQIDLEPAMTLPATFSLTHTCDVDILTKLPAQVLREQVLLHFLRSPHCGILESPHKQLIKDPGTGIPRTIPDLPG